MDPKIPVFCPACADVLDVTALTCPHCSTQVSGHYSLPILLRLSREDHDFVLQFLLNSGSLKEMAIQMGKSYPTIRNRLDDVIDKIKQLHAEQDKQ